MTTQRQKIIAVAGGVAVIGGLILVAKKARGEVGAQFYMPSNLQIMVAGPSNGYSITFYTTIENRGGTAGSYQLAWGSNQYTPDYYEEATRIIAIDPGGFYQWTWTWTGIPAWSRGIFTVHLFGEWPANNHAKGVWV